MSARTATARLSRLAAHLGGRSDRELLREFVADRSPAAFAELVRRHGPLVFGVCRRTLRHQQDSEDAFQATFLVLARRAARITAPEKLPGWLHSVAVRTATEIRRMRDQRASRDRQGAEVLNTDRKGAGDSAEQHELAAAVDEVLVALPDHYRLPVVLCELRGLSRKQAAAELGVAEGTLSSRLAKARKLLAERLAKRGFAASAATVAAALAGSASAKVPDQVAALAVGSWSGTISTSVTVASDTVVKALFASKLNGLVAAGGLMLALAGGLMLAPGGAGAQPGDTPTTKAKPDPADALVQQLGSKEFAEREAAEKKLREMGTKALPSVRAGVKSGVPEIAQRSEKVLAAIRKDDVDRFVKAFRADTAFQEKFDHPLWTRWAKIVGDDRGSRELFAELLGVDGAAATLDFMTSAEPKAAGERYRLEAIRMRDQAKPRSPLGPGRSLALHECYLLGEAVFVTYLATFPGTEDAIPPNPRSQDDGTSLEWDPLYLSQTLPWKARPGATWSMSTPDYQSEEYVRLRRMAAPGKMLFLSVLATRKNPETIEMGLHHFSGLPKEILPFAKQVCRNTDLPLKCRVWAFPVLGQCEETDYLPDMAAVQEDKTWVTGFTSRLKGGAGEIDYTIEVRDIAVAVQLLMHKQSLVDYGFVSAARAEPDQQRIPTWQYNTIYHAFPDANTRITAHEKALAFLKTAPKPEPKKDPEAERLVQQLGSKDFTEREAAEKKLREMGAMALPAVRAGLKSSTPEVVERCERVLAHIRTEVIRQRYSKLVGEDKPARELFDLIRGSVRGWPAVVTASEDPSRAGEVYRTRTAELVRVSRGLPPVDENGEPSNPNGPYIHAPPPVPFADVAAWLYLGTLTPGTEKWSFVTHKAWHNQTSSHFEFLPEDDYTSAMKMAKEYTTGALAAPLKALTVKWLEKRRENDGLRAGLTLALRYDIPEVLPAVRALLATANDADVQPPNVAAAIAVVSEFGTKDDVPLLLPHLTDDRVHVSIITELPKGITGNEGFSIADLPGVKKKVCQVRDIAGSAVIKLSGVDAITAGFPMLPPRLLQYPSSPRSLSSMTGVGFTSDSAREEAFERNRVLFKLNPTPKAKPALPKKREKMPDPSPELWKELHLFDEQYRHGTPEKFAELEEKADELAKQFTETDDQARIWYEVAHVAAQSGIDKQTERVRKYAAKCLEISRDPLQRATLYSYLASAEEVAEGVFTEKRRKATGWLLRGYHELLAQELPDEKPELPVVEKIGGIVGGAEQAQARARHAAQMAARQQAVFVQDQVFRRDVLVLQLRGLYKPNPNQADRDDKGPDELKALAAKALPDAAAVKGLMERVMKQ